MIVLVDKNRQAKAAAKQKIEENGRRQFLSGVYFKIRKEAAIANIPPKSKYKFFSGR